MKTFTCWLESHNNLTPEIILGWKVHFDQSRCPYGIVDERNLKVIDTNLIRQALVGLTAIGIGKRIRIPIVISYLEQGSQITGIANAGKRGDQEPTDSPRVVIRRPINAEGKEILDILPHEIGHVLFSTLDAKAQKYIAELAKSHDYLSTYGDPNTRFIHGDKRHWESGNEWFSDVVSKLVNGELEGDPIRYELMSIIAGHGSPHAGVDYKYLF
jgi:hypothetical protein